MKGRATVVLSLALVLAGGAAAQPAGKVPPLIFPVVGSTQYIDDFGQPRPGGTHQGNDLMAARKSIAVAVEPGTITFWTKSASAGCMLYLHGASGTTYLYIHLNNDVGNGNDNRGKCVAGGSYAPGLKDGAHVEAGQPVGFVGDSGDANGVGTHLHFEVHPNDGDAVDPFPYLNKATHLLFSAPLGSTVTLTLTGTVTAATGSGLSLRVSELRVLPGGPIMKSVDAPVSLALPTDVLQAHAVTQVLRRKVIVLSEPVQATLDVLEGKNLSAARVAIAP